MMNRLRSAIVVAYLAAVSVAIVYVPWTATGRAAVLESDAQVALGYHPIWWSPPPWPDIGKEYRIVARDTGPDTKIVVFEVAALTVLTGIPLVLAGKRSPR